MKRFGFVFLLILVLIQFIRPSKNESVSSGNASIVNAVQVPEEVMIILKTSCYDCHSNNTVYPWYANIEPVGWWLANHIREGKKHLNFDEFMNYEPKKAAKKLEEISEMVKEGEMPLKSYTLIHGDSKLSDAQRQLLSDWALSAQQGRIKTPEQIGQVKEDEAGEEME